MTGKKYLNGKKIGAALLALVMLAQIFLLNICAAAEAPVDPQSDLANFISGISVTNDKGGDVGGDFYYEQIYTFKIDFLEGVGNQFEYNSEGHLTYQLPDELVVVKEVTGGEIMVSTGAIVGWYTIDFSGKVEVWFGDFLEDGTPNPGENFIDFTNVGFSLEIDAKMAEDTKAEPIVFGVGATININTIVYPEPGLTVDKGSDYDYDTETVSYEVVIKATGNPTLPDQEISGIKLSDTPFTRATSTGAKSALSGTSASAYYTIKYSVNGGTATDITASVIWDNTGAGGRYGFNYTFAETLEPDDEIIVTYKLNLQELVKENPSFGNYLEYKAFIVGNDVTVTAKGDTLTDSDSVQDAISEKTFINKTGTVGAIDEFEKRYVTWTATVGDGRTSEKLNGKTITDVLADELAFPSLSDISVKVYDSDLAVAATFTADELDAAISGNTLAINLLKADTTPITPDIYRVVIEYKTEIPNIILEETTYDNTVKYETGTGITLSKTAEVKVNDFKSFIVKSVGKAVTDASGRYIPWSLSIGINSVKLNGKTITDVLGSDDMSFPALSDIPVKVFTDRENAHKNTSAYTTFTAAELGAVIDTTIEGTERLTLTIPAAGTMIGATPMPDVYRIVLDYNTEIPETGVIPAKNYTNTAFYGVGPGDPYLTQYITIDDTPPPAVIPNPTNLSKTSTGIVESGGEYFVNYTVSFDVPAGNEGQNINLYDTLEIYTSSRIAWMTNAPTDFVVSVTGGGPAIEYNLVLNTYRWYLYFGTTTGTTSSWQYTDARTVTVTYSVKLSAQAASGSNTTTIEEYLKANKTNRLRNYVYLRKGTTELRSASKLDSWPIHKESKVNASDYGVIDYTVYLNYEARYKLDSIPVFTDTFDANLEYVPGSLKITATNTSGYTYGTLNDSMGADATITITGNKMEIDLEMVNTLSSGINWSNAHRFTITYQLRVKDVNTANNTVLKNQAVIETWGYEFPGDASVTYEVKPVQKGMTTDGSNIADVDIEINRKGMKLIPAGSTDTLLKAHDTMSDNLAIFINSVKFSTQTFTAGKWDGVWIEVPVAAKPSYSTVWSVIKTGDYEVDFIVPDETPVKIEYSALITVSVNTSADISNVIDVYGYMDGYQENGYKVTNTAAQASAGKNTVDLFKEDMHDGSNLGGAEFALYMWAPGNKSYDPSVTEHITIDGKDFYLLQERTTADVTGRAVFDSPWLTPSHNAVYLLVENTPPTGYHIFAAPDNYSFFVINSTIDRTELSDSFSTALGKSVKVDAVADNILIKNKKIMTVTIDGQKTITGSAPAGNTFTFKAVQVNGVGGNTEITGGFTGTGSVTGEGAFGIDIKGLTDSTGTGTAYYFKVTEVIPAIVPANWDYSDQEFWATVVITDDGSSYDVSVTCHGGPIEFVNVYEEPAVTTPPTTEPTTAPTEPTTAPTTEPTTAPTTEPTTAPTTEPTTAPTTEPTTAPTTEPTTAPTTEPTTVPTTEPTTAPTTEPTTVPTVPQNDPISSPTTPSSSSEALNIPLTPRTEPVTTTTVTSESAYPVETTYASETSRAIVTSVTTAPATQPDVIIATTSQYVSSPADGYRPQNVSLSINKRLTDASGAQIGDGKVFALRLYDSSKNLVQRVMIYANQENVIINGLESGTIYYLQEEEGSGFTALGFEIADMTVSGSSVAISIPAFNEGIMNIQVTVSNIADNLLEIPDMPVPLGLYPFPDDPPVLMIPDSLIPRAPLEFPDDNPNTGADDNTGFLSTMSAAFVIGAGSLAVRRIRRPAKKQ